MGQSSRSQNECVPFAAMDACCTAR